jgi:ribosomal protein S18 acetylase RimI-like enzyme
MNPRFEIRSPLSPAEWQTVRELLTAYWNEFEDKTCFTSFEDEMTNIESLYARPGKAKLIAIENDTGAIAGCVGLRGIAPGVAEMKRLYVPPAYRGHHLGKDLAIAIMDKARDMGFNTMVLDTMDEMKAAQGLYRQLGFDVIPPYSDQGSRNVICFGKSLVA